MSKDNILFVVTSLNQGGLETYLLRFIRYAKFSNVTVFCKSGITGDLYQDYIDAGAVIVYRKLGYFSVESYHSFYKFLKKNNFTTICDFTGNFSGLPLCLANFTDIDKRISFYRGSEDHFKPTLFRRLYNNFVKKLVHRYSTKILSNSQAALDYFYPNINKGNPHFNVIYNGIDSNIFVQTDSSVLRQELNIPADAFVVGHTGRLSYAKNHSTIIKVAIDLCRRHSDIYFILAGIGVDDEYGEEIEKLGLENQILLLGYRRDVPKLLNIFDLFFFPSITEGQPNSLIEAMVFGLPIIASDILPIQETVPNDFIPKLISPTDYVSFISKIEDLYCHRDLLCEYTRKEWAADFFDKDRLFNKFKQEL